MADGTNPSQKLHCVGSRTVVGMDALQQCEAPLCERPSPDAATTTSDFNPSDPLSGLVGRNYSIACKEGHAMLSDGWRVERQDTGICRVVSNDPYKVWQYLHATRNLHGQLMRQQVLRKRRAFNGEQRAADDASPNFA